ncbi:membrane protein [Geomicrobium sp. JCM 19037]|uniref:sporulation integral membrane protein YlbJ n=1 Tax=Geomicrobium sp. JCM 19037 TaxID=1460634 RepID=UPI00045F1F45|nr:sporulation integral membrane protein YlbJ [Geomicrobium sp. JCM 19037]GAK04068.1 membrane protein [Geomicrobium sp. JCM 19037]
MSFQKWHSLLLATAATVLAVSLMLFPQQSLEASLRGLSIWWDVVFPSLLPFFIISELLIAFGVVSFIGAYMEPLMRPLFRVPGTGGFVWAMGLASGYPAGAKLTTRLWEDGRISTIEAERLVSFTNSSNPLFIFGAIAIGFFHDPALGIVLAAAHYGGNIIVGLIMRFHGTQTEQSTKKKSFPSLAKAFHLLHEERIKDERPIGKKLGDAVQSSVQTLLMIGGFIILFSVLNEVLSLLRFTEIFAAFIHVLLAMIGLSSDFGIPIVSGLFEMTLGSQLVSLTDTPLKQQAIVTSFLLAFAGLSAQAQAASLLAPTAIRFLPFFVARIMQGFFAACIAAVTFDWLYQPKSAHVFTGADPLYMIEHSVHQFFAVAPFITLITLIVFIFLRHRRLIHQRVDG